MTAFIINTTTTRSPRLPVTFLTAPHLMNGSWLRNSLIEPVEFLEGPQLINANTLHDTTIEAAEEYDWETLLEPTLNNGSSAWANCTIRTVIASSAFAGISGPGGFFRVTFRSTPFEGMTVTKARIGYVGGGPLTPLLFSGLPGFAGVGGGPEEVDVTSDAVALAFNPSGDLIIQVYVDSGAGAADAFRCRFSQSGWTCTYLDGGDDVESEDGSGFDSSFIHVNGIARVEVGSE